METIINVYNKEVIEQLVEEKNFDQLNEIFQTMDARDVVHILDHLGKDIRLQLIKELPPDTAALIMEEIPMVQASEIIGDINVDDAAAIINEMHSDDQADLMMDLDFEEAEAILSAMTDEDEEDLRKLLAYDSESAGGLMITEFISIASHLPVKEAKNYLRTNAEEIKDFPIKHLYVINSERRLVGVVQLIDLILSSPDQFISEIAVKAKSYHYNTKLDDLLGFFEKYDFIGVPIVDDEEQLIGVALRRDVLEADAERSAMEHLESQGIIGGDEIRSMPTMIRAKRRLSWLSVNILLNILAASIIAFHQETLSSVIALAVFLPIISDMSGCSGNQAVAVSMRELSIGTVKPTEAFRVWIQEMRVGIINGFILGLLIAFAAWLWKGNIYFGMVAGGALMINTIIAVSIGGTVPLLLKKYDVDPALASGPILTTITDMCGFFLALTFASMMMAQISGL
jgi:magnesium transporter